MSFAFIFPGQGSQSLKMLDGLLEYPQLKHTFNTAKDISGIDFLNMLQEETPDKINQTINTQPLMLASDVATYMIWIEHGGAKPSIMAGHSLGEWSALVASGVLKFEEALKLVTLRATFMQEAVKFGDGAMAAVLGLEDDKIVEVCASVERETNGVVAGVNFNSPGQVVIAGDKNSVSQAIIALKNNGARKVQLLNVSVPSHCILMLDASKKLANAIENVTFNNPQIPIIHNISAQICSNASQIKEALIKQLYSPVFWSKTIKSIVNMGILEIIECGPGKVLSGLNKRIDERIISHQLHNKTDFENLISTINL